MRHGIKQPIPFKPPRLIGLSERLLASHYENNYGGAVRRLNAIESRLAELDWSSVPGFEINGQLHDPALSLLRRLGRGRRARQPGGIAAWHAIGGPTEPLE
jgi:hypothetical protein